MVEVLLFVGGGLVTGLSLWGWDKLKARHAAEQAKVARKLRGQKAAQSRQKNAAAQLQSKQEPETDQALYGRKSNGEATWGA